MPITPSFRVEFQTRYPASNSLFHITDETVYPDPADFFVDISGTGPDGVPLDPATIDPATIDPATIDPSIDPVSNTIPLPLDVNGEVQCGTYKLVFLTTDNSVVPPVQIRTDFTAVFCPQKVVFTPLWDNNCVVTPLVSVNDGTGYLGVPVSRLMTLSPPPNAPTNTPITSTSLNVNSGSTDVYSGLWSVAIDAIYLVTYPTYFWSYQVTQYANERGVLVDNATKNVACGMLCSINCCMNSAWDRWWTARSKGASNADDLLWTYIEADVVYNRALRDMDCGNDAMIEDRVNQIKKILNCTDDCGDCSSAEGGLIVPRYSGSALTITMNGIGSVTVTPSSGLSFDVALTARAENILTNVYNYALGLSGPLQTTGFSFLGPITTGSEPPLKSWTLQFTGEFPSAVQQYTERFSLSFAGGAVTVTRTNQVLNGSVLQIPGTLDAINGAVLTWLAQPAVINVADFYSTPPAPGPIAYKIVMDVINADYAGGAIASGSTGVKMSVDGGTATGNSNNSAQATIRASDTGLPMTWGSLRTLFRSIDIELIIFANA